jgi:hypothetical protein
MRPYSTAVAPDSSFQNRFIAETIVSSGLSASVL